MTPDGKTARTQGLPLSANPNCYGTAAYIRWSDAWHKENQAVWDRKNKP